MTESLTRPAPTPGNLPMAHRRAAPADSVTPYDRHAWEQAVITGDLHANARVLAFVLAHLAGAAGHLPVGERQHADRLAVDAGLTPRLARISLEALITGGYILRPSIRGWDNRKGVRPITLTLPGGARTEPPHTGQPR
jgi:hypothetical protein